MDPRYDVLTDAARLRARFVDGLAERPVGATAGIAELRERLARPLTAAGEDPRTVIAELVADVEPGLVASAGPRYFGFVVGGALPAAVAADWLTAAWDQNGGGAITAPALAVVEAVAAGWVRELLGLPAGCGVGFVTGCQMAHVTCLAAARHAVLADAGWNVEADGLQGAPALRVVAGANAHVTIARACRILGLGADTVRDRARRRRGADARRRAGRGAGRARRPADRLRAGRRGQQRRVRPARARSSTCAARTAPGATSTARSGSGRPSSPAPAPPARRLRGRRLLGDRRAQVAQRPLRLRHRDRRRRRRASAARWPRPPTTSRPTRATCRGASSRRPSSRAARARVPLYAALRTLGRDGVHDLVDALLRARAADRRPPRRARRRRDPQRRRAQPGARPLRRQRRRHRPRASTACSATARAGRAAAAGTAAPPSCGSPSAAGRRRPPTPIAPPTRSSPRCDAVR